MNFVGHISLFWVYVRRMIVRCRKWDDRPSKRGTLYVRCRKWDDRPRNIVLPPSTNLVNGFVHERLAYYAYRAHTITILFITPSFGILIHQLLRSSPPAWHPFISYPPPSSSSSAWHEAKTNGAAAVEVFGSVVPNFKCLDLYAWWPSLCARLSVTRSRHARRAAKWSYSAWRRRRAAPARRGHVRWPREGKVVMRGSRASWR
jgi:hypothetical protein